MRIRALLMAVLAASPFAAASPADAQLRSQRVSGINRLCIYRNPNPAQGRRTPDLVRRIGAGEPCPSRYTPPPEQPREVVPSMAMLQEERPDGQRILCIYQFSGREYTHALPAGSRCPLTPHFFR
jgi:hypothetical protein